MGWRFRDELDAVTFDSVSRMIAGGIVLGGLVGAALVGTGAIGEGSSVSAVKGEPVVESAERSPVCLRVDPREVGMSTPLEAAVVQTFPTAGDDLFSGWPQRVDGAWRWDRETPGESGEASSLKTSKPVEDARGVAWRSLRYDLAEAGTGSGLGQGLRLVVPDAYVGKEPPRSGLPTPDDPSSIPPGGTLVLDSTSYEASARRTAYEALVSDVPFVPSREAAVGVTPASDTVVTVTVGSAEAVARTAFLWPGTTEVHTEIVHDAKLPSFALRQYSLDLGSRAGRDVYASLLKGSAPADDAKGVREAAVVTGGDVAADRARALESGERTFPQSFFADGLERTVREDADGTVTLTRSVAGGDQQRRFSETYDIDGRTGAVEAAISVRGVPSAVASEYNRSFAGRAAEVSGAVNLDLDLDLEDLARIRADAAAVAADWFNVDSDGKRFARDVLRLKGLATDDDVSAWLEDAQPAVVDRIATSMAGSNASTAELAAANVLRALAEHGDDPWSTYTAFTSALVRKGTDAPTALAQWGGAVQRATRDAYRGFGDATCASVDDD